VRGKGLYERVESVTLKGRGRKEKGNKKEEEKKRKVWEVRLLHPDLGCSSYSSW